MLKFLYSILISLVIFISGVWLISNQIDLNTDVTEIHLSGQKMHIVIQEMTHSMKHDLRILQELHREIR